MGVGGDRVVKAFFAFYFAFYGKAAGKQRRGVFVCAAEQG